MDWNKTLERLEYWDNQDYKWQSAINKFCETIATDSFPPLLSSHYAEAFIKGVCNSDDESETSLYGWLSYWLYEAKTMGIECEVKDEKGRRYDFVKRKDVIRFFENNF